MIKKLYLQFQLEYDILYKKEVVMRRHYRHKDGEMR